MDVKRTTPKNPTYKYRKPLCPKCNDFGYVRRYKNGYEILRCGRCKAGKLWDGKTL